MVDFTSMVNFTAGRPPLSIKVHTVQVALTSSHSFIYVTTGGTMC